MGAFDEKIAKVKTAMDNRYENKQSNKKTVISGSYSGDNDSCPTVLACINKFGELITSWSVEPSDTKYPSEKLVKTELDKKIEKSQTTGLVKNDGTIDTTTYLSSLPSHTHGNLQYDGSVGTTNNASKNVVTDANGKITTEAKPTIPSKISDLTNDSDFIETSSTSGLVKNDGTIDTTAYITSSSLPTKTSDLTNDGDGTNVFVKDNDSRLTNSRTPTSHTHGNISNDGKIGSTSGKPLITGTGGAVTVGDFGTTSGTFAEGDHTHSQYLTSHQSLSDIGGTVTIEKQSSAETGYTATYVVKQGGTALSPKINIPKDYLVKSATLETVGSTPTTLETSNSLTTGDKYLKFVVNTQENDDSTTLVIPVNELVDTYTADNTTLQISNNQFSVKNGGIGTTQLSSGVNTSLGYADAYHSSPASSITSTQITNWDTMVSGGMTQSDVDARINQALDDLAELIYPTSS